MGWPDWPEHMQLYIIFYVRVIEVDGVNREGL